MLRGFDDEWQDKADADAFVAEKIICYYGKSRDIDVNLYSEGCKPYSLGFLVKIFKKGWIHDEK